MAKKNPRMTPKEQSAAVIDAAKKAEADEQHARFVEAAYKVEADQATDALDKAFKKIDLKKSVSKK